MIIKNLIKMIVISAVAGLCTSEANSTLRAMEFHSDDSQRASKVFSAIQTVGYINPIRGYQLAQAITKYSDMNHVNPELLVAIIMAESSFMEPRRLRTKENRDGTHDISIAQINVERWAIEFPRRKLGTLDAKRLRTDETYAVEVLAKILKSLSKKKTKDWFAYYHSNRPLEKKMYFLKVSKTLQLINPSLVASNHI